MPEDVKITDQQVLFWKGWPSQWVKSPFEIDAVQYNCCEQYMMAEKARLFGDGRALEQIMASSSPRDQKAIGRQVSNFDPDEWNRVCRGIVYRANLAKFSQDHPLKQLLLGTGNRTIVEASPVDRIWGIGLGQDDPRCLDESLWQGSNWLGVALMQVRQTLHAQESGQPVVLDAWLTEQLQRRKTNLITRESS